MTLPKSKRESTSAVEAVVDFVETGIRGNAFPDGGRLPNEGEICVAVGVSRTPVREAMKVLEAVGVVEIRRGVGTYVRPKAASALGHLILFKAAMKQATPRQLFETRYMVERTATELLANRRTEADLVALKKANKTMHHLWLADPVDLDQLTDADVAFHHAVFDACGNDLVAAIGRFVVSLFSPWIREGHRQMGGMVAVENHNKIIDVIEKRDVEGAHEASYDRTVAQSLEQWQAVLERSQTQL